MMKLSPKCRLILASMVLFFLSGLEGQLWTQEKEDLLFQEIPVVVTASRKEQPITEAPTTITIITSDDIRYSGATNIPDILRMVAGVDVMTITARDQQVGVRGFITPMNNKLLVLVDGRTVYTDLYGIVGWDLFPVGLQEIDRIEVVKSPTSSIYGANAFSGVINIITKTPVQLQGTTFHFTGGSHQTLIGSILHAGEVANKTRYKVSAQWDQIEEWNENESPENTAKAIRFNAMLEYVIGKMGKLVLSAGRAHVKNRKLYTGGGFGPSLVDDRMDHLQLDFEYDNLKFRIFFKSEKPRFNLILAGLQQAWDIATFDTELLHTFELGRNHSLVWGFNYRYNKLEQNPLLLQDQRQNLWALFLEDEIKVLEQLRLTLGWRYDQHPLVGAHFSPRGSIFYSPTPKHIFRLSVSKAFRNPSFVDSYFYAERQFNIILGPPLPPVNVPYTVINKGNQDLKSESITAYEIGYQSTWSNHLKLNLNLFYNRYSDFFAHHQVITYYKTNEIFPGSPGDVVPKTIVTSFKNRGDAWGIGGEINLDFLISDGVSGFGNYSFLEITDEDDDPYTIEINEKDRVRFQYPKHKVNAGLRFFFKNGISLNLVAHWVDKTKKLINNSEGNTYLAPVDDYFILNARLGYSFWRKKAELAISLFNLFNDKHYEYPPGTGLSIPYSDWIGRRVTFTLTVKF